MIYNDPMIWLKSNVDPLTLAPNNDWYKGDSRTKRSLGSINIVDKYTPTGNEIESWNADVNDIGTIKCYVSLAPELIITTDGAGLIKCNADSSMMFSDFDRVATISGIELLDTSSVRDMSRMFNYCAGLTALDLSSFNTSSVRDMSSMFYRCRGLTALDLSSFNTSSVTNMNNMFNSCGNLVTIYASNLWSTVNVISSARMFYTCFSLVGDIAYEFGNDDKTYATTSGGYLTYKAA